MKVESDQDFEVVSSASRGEIEKKRVKTSGFTMDISLIDSGDEDPEKVVETRKNKIADADTEVPDPYRFNTQKISGDTELDFGSLEGREFGEGFVDHEFLLCSIEESRYRYYVTWKTKNRKVIEKELYISSKVERSELSDLMEQFSVFRS